MVEVAALGQIVLREAQPRSGGPDGEADGGPEVHTARLRSLVLYAYRRYAHAAAVVNEPGSEGCTQVMPPSGSDTPVNGRGLPAHSSRLAEPRVVNSTPPKAAPLPRHPTGPDRRPRLISDSELAGLWYRLGGAERIGNAILALGIANRAAYMLTFGGRRPEAATVVRPRLTGVRVTGSPNTGWTVMEWAQNLVSNCVSFRGTSYAPSTHVETLLSAARWTDSDRRYA